MLHRMRKKLLQMEEPRYANFDANYFFSLGIFLDYLLKFGRICSMVSPVAKRQNWAQKITAPSN